MIAFTSPSLEVISVSAPRSTSGSVYSKRGNKPKNEPNQYHFLYEHYPLSCRLAMIELLIFATFEKIFCRIQKSHLKGDVIQTTGNSRDLGVDTVFIVNLRAIRVHLCGGYVAGIGKTHTKTKRSCRIVDHAPLL